MTNHIRWIPSYLLLSLILGGCQGTGEIHNFNLHALPSSPARSEAFHDDSMTILVQPFQDHRDQTQRIGHRTHFWGGTTQFNAWNGNVGDGLADLALEYLLQRKWQAARDRPTAEGSPSSPTDVILSGDVLILNANAKSGFGFTDIEVKMKVGFEAKNLYDGSTVRMVLGANGSDRVVTFDPKDIEKLTNLVAKDLFNQLFQDLTVKDKAFHLKSEVR